MDVLGDGAAGGVEVREEGVEWKRGIYLAAKHAITLVMRLEDLMFACKGVLFFFQPKYTLISK